MSLSEYIVFVCAHCGRKVIDTTGNLHFCPHCQKPLEEPLTSDEKIVVCAHCEREVVRNADLNFCPYCDKPLMDGPMIDCPSCKKSISRKALVCVHCGRPMQPDYTKKIYTLLKWVVIVSVVSGIILGLWYGHQVKQLMWYLR